MSYLWPPSLTVKPDFVSSWLLDLQGLIPFVPEHRLHPSSCSGGAQGCSLVHVTALLRQKVSVATIKQYNLSDHHLHLRLLLTPPFHLHPDVLHSLKVHTWTFLFPLCFHSGSSLLLTVCLYKYSPSVLQPFFHSSLYVSPSPITSLQPPHRKKKRELYIHCHRDAPFFSSYITPHAMSNQTCSKPQSKPLLFILNSLPKGKKSVNLSWLLNVSCGVVRSHISRKLKCYLCSPAETVSARAQAADPAACGCDG